MSGPQGQVPEGANQRKTMLQGCTVFRGMRGVVGSICGKRSAVPWALKHVTTSQAHMRLWRMVLRLCPAAPQIFTAAHLPWCRLPGRRR